MSDYYQNEITELNGEAQRIDNVISKIYRRGFFTKSERLTVIGAFDNRKQEIMERIEWLEGQIANEKG